MSLETDITDEVDAIIAASWTPREGEVVPETDDVALAGGAVELNATVLYSDLADSTALVLDYLPHIAVEVMKCFLAAASRVIRSEGGRIRSFDGDRVMGIYLGKAKNTSAARTALKINWAFRNVVAPRLQAAYSELHTGTFALRHATGVDTSLLYAVRGGMRNNNDLVWVGRAPNIAAKLSSIRMDPFYSYVTPEVYQMMNESAKYQDGTGVPMWEYCEWSEHPEVGGVWRSSWWWSL